MSLTHWTLPPTKDANRAQQQYVEQFGSVLVTNTYLKIALLALALVCLGLVGLNVQSDRVARDVKPLVIRINDVGRAEAVKFDSFDYEPREAEIRYFLIDFVQRHYGRVRATLKENYARSLFFLDARLAEAAMEANKNNNAIEAFLAGSTDEIEIEVNNVAIEDLRVSPYK